MATQAKEANPYNANKEWHNQKENPPVGRHGDVERPTAYLNYLN